MCNRSSKQYIQTLIFFLLFFAYLPVLAANDSNAMKGIKNFKGVFDVKVGKAQEFAFFLEVINKTFQGIVDQGGQPEFVVTVRGPAIRFISSETWSFSEEDQQHLDTSATLIKDLTEQGVRFEACSIAASLFRIDHDTYLAEVHPVGNTFISLIGYQAQGFGLVPIN